MAINTADKRQSALLDEMLSSDGTIADNGRMSMLGQYGFRNENPYTYSKNIFIYRTKHSVSGIAQSRTLKLHVV
jgi:hypothetical protein